MKTFYCILLSQFIFIISRLENPFCSSIIQCLEDSTDICQKREIIEEKTITSLRSCPINQACWAQTGTCVPLERPLLPGLFCTDNTQCQSGKCKNNTCIGKNLDEECSSSDECNPGMYCNTKCTPLLKKGEKCNNHDSECETDSGCLNGICTEYFTLNDGEKTVTSFFCKSFYSKGGVCATIKRKTPELICASDQVFCNYTITKGEQSYDIQEPCTCSYSNYGKMMCPIETEGNLFHKAVEAYKKHFKFYAPKMNTNMRFELIDREIALARMKIDKFPFTYQLDDCVLDALLELAYKLPSPTRACNTIYKCNDDPSSDICSSSTTTEEGTVVNTIKKCPDKQKCVYNSQNEKGTCEDDTNKLTPGFYCDNITQCLSGECTNSTCIGKKEGDQCSIDEDCHIGLFCNVDKCSPLVDVGGDCERDVHCKSNAFCHHKKCTEYFTLEDGEQASDASQCKSFLLAEKNGIYVCASRTKLSSEVECAADQSTCSYSYSYGGESKTKLELECECTLTSPDVRVCPLATDSDEYKEGIKAMKKHYSEYSPRMHTTAKGLLINRDIMIDVYKATKYSQLYKLSDCVIDGMFDHNYKLPSVPASGGNTSLNHLLFILVLIIIL